MYTQSGLVLYFFMDDTPTVMMTLTVGNLIGFFHNESSHGDLNKSSQLNRQHTKILQNDIFEHFLIRHRSGLVLKMDRNIVSG